MDAAMYRIADRGRHVDRDLSNCSRRISKPNPYCSSFWFFHSLRGTGINNSSLPG